MVRNELQNRILAELEDRKMTTSDLVAEIGEPEQVLKDAILMLSTDGTLGQDGDRYYVVEEGGGVLSDSDWEIIDFLKDRKGKSMKPNNVAMSLGGEGMSAALMRLAETGIVVKDKGGGYKITSESELEVPLSPSEREELGDAEALIDGLVEEIHDKQLEVARQLRRIRDKRLYRETHKQFSEYVAERFERTRDWAYKLIAQLDVMEGLTSEKPNADVEALLQTVTARDIPHLAKLKKEPAKMQEALLKAEETARSEKRDRKPDDVKEAVESLKPKPEPTAPPPAPQKKLRKVTFTGITHPEVETEHLPGFFKQFADWIEKNPSDGAFTVKVAKAKTV